MLQNIGRGLSALGPNMTLDTLVEVLLIGIGTISGQPCTSLYCTGHSLAACTGIHHMTSVWELDMMWTQTKTDDDDEVSHLQVPGGWR